MNVKEYGLLKVLKNILYWVLDKSISVDYVEKGRKYHNVAHVFNMYELEKLVDDVGLKIDKMIYLDYKTGKRTSRFGGQLVLVISPCSL